MNFYYYSKYNGKSTIEQLRRVTFFVSSSSFHIVWDKDTQVDQNALLDTYIEGMRLLMSIAYDLQIDEIKNHEEMPEKSSSVDLLFKVNQDILDLRNGYSPIKLQDALDDYFHFGFSLGITFDDMLEGL